MKDELDKYFSGELSDKEKNALFDKIDTDKNYKSEFILMQNTAALSKLHSRKGDEEFAVRMMSDLVKNIKRRQVRRICWSITKYAALIALLIINGWVLTSKVITPEKIEYTTVEAPAGQRVCMTLMDGTEVWLSPRSILRISNNFNKDDRLVELDGEGYFSVTKNAKKPFVVQTQKHNVKVLGTRFNVFAYSESSRFETDLMEGRVEIFDKDNPERLIELSPGEKISFENSRLIKTKSQFNNEEYLKNGIFSFSNKPFREILEYLTLWYDVEFDIKDSAKKELPVSGKFRQSDEVKNILKALQGVHTFRYEEINERKIEIY